METFLTETQTFLYRYTFCSHKNDESAHKNEQKVFIPSKPRKIRSENATKFVCLLKRLHVKVAKDSEHLLCCSGCTNYVGKKPGLDFYSFPADTQRRKNGWLLYKGKAGNLANTHVFVTNTHYMHLFSWTKIY